MGVYRSHGTWDVNPREEPPEIDLQVGLSGMGVLGEKGIYRKLEGDRMEICCGLGGRSRSTRPKVFDSAIEQLLGGGTLQYVRYGLKEVPADLITDQEQLQSREIRGRLAGTWRVVDWEETLLLIPDQSDEVLWEFTPAGRIIKHATFTQPSGTVKKSSGTIGRYRLAPKGGRIDLYMHEGLQPWVGWYRVQGNSLLLEAGPLTRRRPTGPRGKRTAGDQGGRFVRIEDIEKGAEQ